MTRMIRTLVAIALVAGPGAFGIMTMSAASATTAPGTYGAGSWFFDPGTGVNAIQPANTTTSTTTSTVYQAQVQQPINADGSSTWSSKKGVIPVQFTLQQATSTATTTITTDAVYPGTLESDLGATYPSVGDYGALSFTPPTGTTVGNITNLTADFSWLNGGNNHTGSMRWSIVTPDGVVYVYYGDLSSTFQSGQGGSGVNMATVTDARVEGEGSFSGSPLYDTWSDVLSRTAPSGTVANETVSEIDLVVDAGYAGTQQVALSDVQITGNGSTGEYVPGTVPGSTSTTHSLSSWTATTSPAMYIDVVKGNASDPGTVDETTYTGVGDSGGQFAVVDGKYKYNLSNSSQPLGSAGTYYVYMNSSATLGNANRIPTSNAPGGIVSFVLK
jgi:hypothetical protein